MNALTFWFYFVLFGSGCGFVSVIVLIILAVRNRPRKPIDINGVYGCSKCGNTSIANRSLCSHCGTRIKWRKK